MSSDVDVVVIGGGIHGAGVAQAAAAAGHSVLLLEKTGFGAGTSSKSSKLIHGGLRYLEQAEFSLVRECLRERKVLLSLAPELVELREFYIPIYKTTKRRPWQIRLGLSLYFLLAFCTKEARFRKVPEEEWNSLDGLKSDSLQAVFQYQDAQTDDRALTAAVIHSAKSLGAEIACPALFTSATISSEFVEVHYELGGAQKTCKAAVIVNAAGPWVNSVAEAISPRPKTLEIDLVQGAHIVLPFSLDRGIYYMEHPEDQRAVFLMPWGEDALLGTTETTFSGSQDSVSATVEEQQYLLAALHHYFPEHKALSLDSIRTAFAGLRVLPKSSSSAFGRSRETILMLDCKTKPRVLSIYGGKLTAYRAEAEKVMNKISRSLPQRTPKAGTDTLALHPTEPL